MIQPQLHFLGDGALLCNLPPPATLAHQQRIWSIADAATQWPEVAEVVPGMNNLTLILRRPVADMDAVSKRILSSWKHVDAGQLSGRDVDIPVVYGGADGPDLDVIARHTGLSTAEVIRRHSEGEYVVYFIGFMPGFAYMGGLDPQLATPRQNEPRLTIPAGSVGIGGEQTGIYPLASPGGWQLLGRTALSLFDPTQNPPTLLRPGDRVRFTVERIAK
ncbi:allophanate hydrolase [Herbaspirillum hiltneri N3]|uniref:Allophanate hydrolase n=1 Tax=Herbaspirillum hiltneri N3 TaxID=1262470 RepID=A0ABN4HZ82_9BURK|nr:5-oxoprolinase subunit PxpB [Herbaspirillum hiltneri]AKZ64090.1 allophanate hydrolase [Herbaspirillum hiltneri N3]